MANLAYTQSEGVQTDVLHIALPFFMMIMECLE